MCKKTPTKLKSSKYHWTTWSPEVARRLLGGRPPTGGIRVRGMFLDLIDVFSTVIWPYVHRDMALACRFSPWYDGFESLSTSCSRGPFAPDVLFHFISLACFVLVYSCLRVGPLFDMAPSLLPSYSSWKTAYYTSFCIIIGWEISKLRLGGGGVLTPRRRRRRKQQQPEVPPSLPRRGSHNPFGSPSLWSKIRSVPDLGILQGLLEK